MENGGLTRHNMCGNVQYEGKPKKEDYETGTTKKDRHIDRNWIRL